MNRDEAYRLLTEYTTREGLIKHALAVESAMRAYARRFGEDPDTWGVVGLLHDFDYERFPDSSDHPYRGAEILRERGAPEEWVQAVMGHADHTGVQRASLMARALYAVDELAGFIVAVTLVRPSKKLDDVKVSSVKKKMKDKAFAASVSREDMRRGAEELGVPLEEHIGVVLQAMKDNAAALGL
ncbi:MAG: HDIG domain-containing metalloprotein [Spirochaetota bacterium]